MARIWNTLLKPFRKTIKTLHEHSTPLLPTTEGHTKSGVTRTRIALTVVLGTLVLGFVILLSVLLSGQPAPFLTSESAEAQRRDVRGIELSEVLYGQLMPRGFNGTFVSATEILYRNSKGDVALLDVLSKQTEILLPGDYPLLETAISYTLSADRKYLLIAHTVQKLFRYSYIAHYDAFDLETKTSIPIQSTEGYRLHLLAVWGPIDNAIAFVSHDNQDIYYKSSVYSPAKRVTHTGTNGIIYNGIPDWVNEEEIFNTNEAMWFSPNGDKLAYASFNDSNTRIMSIPYYGVPGNLDFQYTRAVNIKYPKPGTPNPVVTLYTASLSKDSIGVPVRQEIPPQLSNTEPILSSVTWATEEQLVAVWMNRVQNESYISLCVALNGSCRNILSLREPKGWIAFVTHPKFSTDGSSMILVLPQLQDNGVEYRQICIATKGSNGEFVVKPLTKGQSTVTEILDYDSDSGKIYYTAVKSEATEIQHVYLLNIKDGGNKAPECITCEIRTNLQNTPCNYNTATFSADTSKYILSCLGPGVTEITVRNSKQENLLTWEDNVHIYEDVRSRQLPIVERLKVRVGENFVAQVQLYLPPDINREKIGKYPMLVHVYGGPDTSQNHDKFQINWSTYLAVNRSIIYATIDGRGSANQGNDMLFSIYRRLGTYEVQDQINVTRQIHKEFPFIDKGRTAIWGWSYGGYASAMTLAQDHLGVFKCGMSVAPVTDWAYYDTLYTELWMTMYIINKV